MRTNIEQVIIKLLILKAACQFCGLKLTLKRWVKWWAWPFTSAVTSRSSCFPPLTLLDFAHADEERLGYQCCSIVQNSYFTFPFLHETSQNLHYEPHALLGYLCCERMKCFYIHGLPRSYQCKPISLG